MYGNVVRVEFWASVVPPNHMLASCQGERRGGIERGEMLRTVYTSSTPTVDFLEHGGHVLHVVMVEKPDTWVPLIFIKWN